MSSPSNISLSVTTSLQSEPSPCSKQHAAVWAFALDKSWSRFPLLCVLAKEESLSYNTARTHNTSCHPRGSGKSRGSTWVLTSVLLGCALALLEAQQLCETWGLIDSWFLMCVVMGGRTTISLCARAFSWVQSSESVLYSLLPLYRAGMQSYEYRVWLCACEHVCSCWGAWMVSISPSCWSRSILGKILTLLSTDNHSVGVQWESCSLSYSLSQGLCKYLAGNVPRECTGT